MSVIAGACCFGEPISTVIDSKGHPTCNYKIDSVLPEGIIVRTEGKTIWLDAPLTQPGLRKIVAQNQNTTNKPAAPLQPETPSSIPVHEISQPLSDASLPSKSKANHLTFDLGWTTRAATVVSQRIQSTEQLDDAIRNIPGADTARELPWDFVRNEGAMLLI